MMSIRIPVAVWQDAEGSYTACTLDGPHAAAIDGSPAEALTQIKKYRRSARVSRPRRLDDRRSPGAREHLRSAKVRGRETRAQRGTSANKGLVIPVFEIIGGPYVTREPA
jgi:hypothetical protein